MSNPNRVSVAHGGYQAVLFKGADGKWSIGMIDTFKIGSDNEVEHITAYRELLMRAQETLERLTRSDASSKHVRPERSFEQYEHAAQLVQAIRSMWSSHSRLTGDDVGQVITKNVEALMSEYDLSLKEWFYWAKIARANQRKLA